MNFNNIGPRTGFFVCLLSAAVMMLGLFSMSGCSKSDPTGPYTLTAEEAMRAKASAENYFRQQIWPVKGEEGRDEMKSGIFVNCRPTDSNSNGRVSCQGKTPQYKGGWLDTTMYCG